MTIPDDFLFTLSTKTIIFEATKVVPGCYQVSWCKDGGYNSELFNIHEIKRYLDSGMWKLINEN